MVLAFNVSGLLFSGCFLSLVIYLVFYFVINSLSFCLQRNDPHFGVRFHLYCDHKVLSLLLVMSLICSTFLALVTLSYPDQISQFV